MAHPQWLDWAQRLQALAQTGLNYDPRPFDKQRYEQIRDLAAEIVAAHSDAPLEQIAGLMSAQTGHATPKIDSRGVIFREDKILLVQEKLDNDRWTLPGGWVDIGEPPSVAVEREVWEETGYRVRAVKLLALYDRHKHGHPPSLFHAYKVFFRCDLLSDERNEAPNIETGVPQFFALDALPELSTARVTATQIARFFEHLQNPDWQTDFD